MPGDADKVLVSRTSLNDTYSVIDISVLKNNVRTSFSGTKLLNYILDLSAKQGITEIYMHVQTNNEDAIKFYKKFGFEITETIKNYYAKNISPPDCYVLSKLISPSPQKN